MKTIKRPLEINVERKKRTFGSISERLRKPFICLLTILLLSIAKNVMGQHTPVKELLYGVAYYDEYMPYDRIEQDARMMQKAGINVVRIAESTWSTVNPEEDKYDFTHIDRVLKVMPRYGIRVIVGMPTYAVPYWLVKKYPDILAVTPAGKNLYGMRQNMDITNIHYREYARKVITQIMEHVKDNPNVIGYQIDNETKAYKNTGDNVQKLFQAYMKTKFQTVDSINRAFGLDYWSNRINNWDQFPPVTGSINASMTSEFQKFERHLVSEFLNWEATLVKSYKRPDQFITHNFDLEWRGYSYGIQPDVDQFDAAKCLDIAGVDIYHPTQDHLTGAEISFGGDLARGMKNGKNYLVMETEAQGFPQWLPYPGQLKLQAFSHLASGADMVAYWPWHSIHNSAETYWKGLVGHDFQENPTYNEAIEIGQTMHRLSPELVNLKITHKVAMLFSNEALTAFNAFSFGWGRQENYNDLFRPWYDALYRLNIGTDLLDPSRLKDLNQYSLLIVPTLYAASDSLLEQLNEYVKQGGHIVYTFKSGFSNENVKVRPIVQPGIISEACGVTYNQFTLPENVKLKDDPYHVGADNSVEKWMELLKPTTAKVLAYYDHPVWGKYAAITENNYGKGTATYVGFLPTDKLIEKILEQAVNEAGITLPDQALRFPLITKSGVNQKGKRINYYFNYSPTDLNFIYTQENGVSLLDNKEISKNQRLDIAPWGVVIIEEN